MADTFRHTIAALVAVLIDEIDPEAPPAARDQVRSYVLATTAAMPDHFRLGFRMLALLLEGSTLPRGGHRFTHSSVAVQKAQVRRWQQSSFGLKRAMIAFFQAFAAHGLYCAAYRGTVPVMARAAA